MLDCSLQGSIGHKGDTVNWTNELQQLRESDTSVDLIVKVYEEAAQVHEEALIAMGRLPAAASSSAASTEVAIALDSDLSSGERPWNRRRCPER